MYLLDTNVFIEAKNRYYDFAVCPAFWDWVEKEHQNGKLYSISQVKDELAAGKDDLSDWANGMPSSFWRDVDGAVANSMMDISRWVNGDSFYLPTAKAEFLRVADYYLVAHGHATGMAIVTHEGIGGSAKRIKIPNVCQSFSVKYMSPFNMLKDESARFVLS